MDLATSKVSALPHRLAYRPDVDGLRALAVLGVVLFHAGLGVPGGFIGVDVFFVISGFLITSLILKDLRAGTFSFLNFWERRARRILPALSLVVIATLVVGWFLLLPADYQGLARSVMALAVFSSNILFWHETGYFSPDGEEHPLLHTWSLSVEEQFYLLIPLFLVVMFRFRKASWIVPFLMGGAVLSLAVSAYKLSGSPTATFFFLPTRAWELAAGSLLAFARPVSSSRLRSWMAWGGLAAITVPFFLYTESTPFPGPAAIPPVAGAALLIWSGFGIAASPHRPQQESPGGESAPPVPLKLLAMGPMVWIGTLSYSLYLWHWPFFSYYHYLYSTSPALLVSGSFVLISISLAWLSLHFVERPCRSRTAVPATKPVLALSGTVAALILCVAVGLWRTEGFPQRLAPEVVRIAAATDDSSFLNNMKLGDVPENLTEVGVSEEAPGVLVWGDSHAMAILPAVDAACREIGISGAAATSYATAPVLDWFFTHRYGLSEDAPEFNRNVMDYIRAGAENGSLRHVILAARWGGYLEDNQQREAIQDALATTVRAIRATGCEVILFKEVPTFPRQVPKALALHRMVGWDSLKPVVAASHHTEKTAIQDATFAHVVKETGEGVHVLDPLPFLMKVDTFIEPVDPFGMPLYVDDNHLSASGSLLLTKVFSRFLLGDAENQDPADPSPPEQDFDVLPLSSNP